VLYCIDLLSVVHEQATLGAAVKEVDVDGDGSLVM
jgi:hypothetical protein